MRTRSSRAILNCPQGPFLRARAPERLSALGQSDAAEWFSNWERGGILVEEARHLAQWDQTLTLIWFESGELPLGPEPAAAFGAGRSKGVNLVSREDEGDGELGLKELDGNLRWPGKKRRGNRRRTHQFPSVSVP
jgi:hypothetical protein